MKARKKFLDVCSACLDLRSEIQHFLKEDMNNCYIPKMPIYRHLYQRQHEEQTDEDLFINKQLPLYTLTEKIKHCISFFFYTDYLRSSV